MPPDPVPDNLVHLRADEGRSVTRLNGESTVVKLEPEWTRGAYALRSNTAPPRFVSVPLHVHRDMEEAFVVVSGTMSVMAGSRRLDAGPGEVCLIPRGVPHALANLGDVPVSWLTMLSPGDQSGWIDDEEALIARAGGDRSLVDDAALHAVHERYGLEILGPPPDWEAPTA
jgi:mannose-6-phosphate isomerase-like protein (cupin superfamily)